MKKVVLFFCLFNLVLLISLSAKAQDSAHLKTADSTISNLRDSLKEFEKELEDLLHPKKSYFKADLGFLNNNVYFGRKDSLVIPYITGSLGYYHKSGLYINALASYLPTAGQSRFDLFTIEAGYNYKAGNFEMQLAGSKFFYSTSSYNVESEIKANIVAAFTYDFNFITPVVQSTVIFGQSTDYAASFGLERSFYALKNHLDITPSVMVNASTQNYYSSYYKYRRYALKRFKIPVNYTIIAEILNPSKFKVLDYELSLPLNYIVKKITINFTPVYSIPVNPATLRITRKIGNVILAQKDHYEKLSNSFFFQAGVSYKF